MTGDVDVALLGTSLSGKRVALGITGGIAAVESVRLCRELRRHGADVTVFMTTAATKVITPLAVEWASQATVVTKWEAEMSQLESFDTILIAPATRNFISRYLNGMMDHPLLMACSAGRGRGVPIVIVPSMNSDLYDDPVTQELLNRMNGEHIVIGPIEEGRYKQPNPETIVAQLCHHTNANKNSKRFVVTLGANRAPIDSVRAIQNASSGNTGWKIAEYLHREGHEVIAIAGTTSAVPAFPLPHVIRAEHPDDMLEQCIKIAREEKPDGWVHAAAVLDYFTEPIEGKKLSGDDDWVLELMPGRKHIQALTEYVGTAKRIGFKLETGVTVDQLHHRAREQISAYDVDATIANLMEEMHNENTPRAYLVTNDGVTNLDDLQSVCEAICSILTK